MTKDIGKQFEERFKLDWLESFPDSSITRLYDTQWGSNICDFICYNYPNIFFIECKEHKGASIPFSKIRQHEKLKSVVGIHGVRAGVVLWLSEKDIVMYIPASTITKMKKAGEKSVGLRSIDKYNIKIMSSNKLVKFMKTDYAALATLEDFE